MFGNCQTAASSTWDGILGYSWILGEVFLDKGGGGLGCKKGLFIIVIGQWYRFVDTAGGQNTSHLTGTFPEHCTFQRMPSVRATKILSPKCSLDTTEARKKP